MYKYLFGPVPSRRLGISLGIDLVPKKVCSLDCVYCEVGKTSVLTRQRKEYIPYKKLVEELKYYLENNVEPDFLTITGSGEPTLNSKIGDIIQYIKQTYIDLPVAVLTNGTLLNDPKVRAELMKADLVLPSLDAASNEVFQRMNGPLPELSVEEHVQGLIKFRECFTGKIWLEVFILPGYNDSKAEIRKLKELIQKISPDTVQLNTLDRPGVLQELYPASNEELKRITKSLAVKNVEIVVNPQKQNEVLADKNDVESTILNTLLRRPCTIDDLIKITGLPEEALAKHLINLANKNKITSFLQNRGRFYRGKEAV